MLAIKMYIGAATKGCMMKKVGANDDGYNDVDDDDDDDDDDGGGEIINEKNDES